MRCKLCNDLGEIDAQTGLCPICRAANIARCQICKNERLPNSRQCKICGCIFDSNTIEVDDAAELGWQVGKFIAQLIILFWLTYTLASTGWAICFLLYESRQSKIIGLAIGALLGFGISWEAFGEIETYRSRNFKDMIETGFVVGIFLFLIIILGRSIGWLAARSIKLFRPDYKK